MNDTDAMQFVKGQTHLEGQAQSAERMRPLPASEGDSEISALEPLGD